MKSSFDLMIDDIKAQVKENGCSLTQLDSSEHAEKLVVYLKKRLPRHLDVWVVDARNRANEVNVYTVRERDDISESKPERIDDRSDVRTSPTVGMPSKFKRWKEQQFKL